MRQIWRSRRVPIDIEIISPAAVAARRLSGSLKRD
jgi:hypothetical protein